MRFKALPVLGLRTVHAEGKWAGANVYVGG